MINYTAKKTSFICLCCYSMSSFLFGKRFSQQSNLHNLLAMVYNFMSGLPKKKKVCHTYLHLPLYSTGRKRNVATYRSCHIYYRLKNNNFQFQFTMKEIYEANHGRWPVYMKTKKNKNISPKNKTSKLTMMCWRSGK